MRFFSLLLLLPLASRAEFKLSSRVETSSFITQWDDYQNQSLSGRLRFERGQERLNFKGEVRGSTEQGQYFLGNIESLNYRLTNFSSPLKAEIGRFEPEETMLGQLSVKDHLNQRVCWTTFDCVRGGPIGLNLATHGLSLTLSFANLPNLEPRPFFDNTGRAYSRNRWAFPPIQSAEVSGAELPVRSETHFTNGLRFLYMPGARLSWELPYQGGSFKWTSALEISRSAQLEDEQNIFFFDATPSKVAPGVANSVELDFPYEQIHALSHQHDFGWMKARTEIAFSHKSQASKGSAASRASFRIGVVDFSVGGGMLVEEKVNPLAISSLGLRIRSFRLGVEALSLFRLEERALWISPMVEYQISRVMSVYSRADLISANEDAPMFGLIRGNDRVLVGLRYDL